MSLAQLSQLLPLPNEELQQVLDYALSLSKPEAASHFSNLLGDSPQAIDFIASFNSRRKDPTGAPGPSTSSAPTSRPETPNAVPKSKRHPKKKKPGINEYQAPRKVEDYDAPAGTVYSKKDEDTDYIPQAQRASAPTSNQASRSSTPKPAPKERASAGFLISDHPPAKNKAKSTPVSRSSTPKPAGPSTKVSISGGTPMAGQSTALADLESAIRALEITTNPTLDNKKSRKCNCVATRHPLQGAAPNCLACGKVICMKEGLGPCTFCGAPLLKPDEVQAMMRELKDERGREKMAVDAKANRRAEVSKTPAPFTKPREDISEAETKAREHRDKLLNFQAQNARRTTVKDEAADFDVSGAMAGSGGSMWATPEDRAKELKRQQKLMREMEWNARPEYEKRQQIVSIDLQGRRITKKMAAIERLVTPESDEEDIGVLAESNGNKKSGGTFSANPLLGAMIKPTFQVDYTGKGKGPELEGRKSKKTGWRRVQDDLDDNEDVILDGGVFGHGQSQTQGDEPECG